MRHYFNMDTLYTLFITICVNTGCLAPFQDLREFQSYKECLLAGNTTSSYIIKELSNEDLLKEGFNLKFACIEQRANKVDS